MANGTDGRTAAAGAKSGGIYRLFLINGKERPIAAAYFA
jgi:hypothetical protein